MEKQNLWLQEIISKAFKSTKAKSEELYWVLSTNISGSTKKLLMQFDNLKKESEIDLFNTINNIFEKFWYKVVISDKWSAINFNNNTITINKEKFWMFIKKFSYVAWSCLFIWWVTALSFWIATPAMAAAVPVLDPINVINYWWITILLWFLGIWWVAIKKLINKLKKSRLEKSVIADFDKYKTSTDDREKEKIKKWIIDATMWELPWDIEDTKDIDLEEDELKKWLKIKKEVDELINAALQDVSWSLEIKSDTDIPNLEKLKKLIMQKVEFHYSKLHWKELELGKVFENYVKKWKNPYKSYLLNQILLEKKKIFFMINYLHTVKKNWLFAYQSKKNDLIRWYTWTTLGSHDKIIKDIMDLKDRLAKFLMEQMKMSKDEFEKWLRDFEDKIKDLEKKAIDEWAMFPHDTDSDELVGTDYINFKNDWKFAFPDNIEYSINSQQRLIDLSKFDKNIIKDLSFQFWIWKNNQIKININYKWKLVDTNNLKIWFINKKDFIKDLLVDNTDFKLEDYINQVVNHLSKQKEKTPTSDKEFITPPEAEPILSELDKKFNFVKSAIHKWDYDMFWESVKLDYDSIEYQKLAIHREKIDWKNKSVIRFKLTEAYWKNALQVLKWDKYIPKSYFDFVFEWDWDKVFSWAQVMRFNIIVNNFQIPVIISADSSNLAMVWEVKIVLDSNIDYPSDIASKVFMELANKIKIAEHIKPRDDKSIKYLHDYLLKIRNSSEKPSWEEDSVSPEYDAHTVSDQEIEKMRNMWLHCLYHQVNSLNSIKRVFKRWHLLSTFNRWTKWIIYHWMSSKADFQNGWATSVFLRVHTDSSIQKWQWYSSHKPALIFDPRLFSRMDCYCYTSDQYGSRNPYTFWQRVSPENLVKQMKSYYRTNNEVMFNESIDILKYLRYVVCQNPSEMINELEHMWIYEIWWKPLKAAVITFEQSHKLSQDDLFSSFDSTQEKSSVEEVEQYTSLDQVFKNYNPHVLINYLKKYVWDLYEKDAWVEEKLSLWEHTLMVLRQFEKYYVNEELPWGVDKNIIRLALALHDIWKPDAIAAWNKSNQHYYSTKIINELATKLNISNSTKNLILSLVDGDPFWEYLKLKTITNKDIEKVSSKIRQMAEKSWLKVNHFFELLVIYFKCDTSSYTKDAMWGNQFLDFLYRNRKKGEKLKFSEDTWAKIEKLRNFINW